MKAMPAGAKVLITGATGFLGSHCLVRLLGEPCSVHAVNRTGKGPPHARVTWHAADLRVPDAVRDLVGRVRPTHLLHSAWITTPGRYASDGENLDWLQGGLALLRGFGEAGGTRFVGVGTCAEYDGQQTRFAEDETPVRPSTLYGKAKVAMSAAAQAFSAHYGFSAAWGRVFLPYGPGDHPQRLIPTVLAALQAGRPVEVSQGTQERDFIYAPDAADLLVRLLCAMEAGAFNVATGRGTRVRVVVERLADRVGRRDLIRFGALTGDSGPLRLVADMSKVGERIGWSAPTSLEAGLEKVLNHALDADLCSARRD